MRKLALLVTIVVSFPAHSSVEYGNPTEIRVLLPSSFLLSAVTADLDFLKVNRCNGQTVIVDLSEFEDVDLIEGVVVSVPSGCVVSEELHFASLLLVSGIANSKPATMTLALPPVMFTAGSNFLIVSNAPPATLGVPLPDAATLAAIFGAAPYVAGPGDPEHDEIVNDVILPNAVILSAP